MITIERYGRRNWAVYLNGDLLAVTVYRKGAMAVRNALESAMSLARCLPDASPRAASEAA